VYKVLAEAPDPYPLLEAAVVRASVLHFFVSEFVLFVHRTKLSKLRKLKILRPNYSDCEKTMSSYANVLERFRASKLQRRKRK